MNHLRKGLMVAVLHVLIVLSLGGKLLYDRATKPRVWARTGSIDPDMPIRGRYFTLNLQVHSPELSATKVRAVEREVELAVENGQLVAHPTQRNTHLSVWNWDNPIRNSDLYSLSPALPFFIPEHADMPQLKSGDELWAEVTVPRSGPPRAIQLAIKRGSEWIPLTYR